MRKFIFTLLFTLPLSVSAASHMDVIEFELAEGCSFDNYMEIVSDFNNWAADYGYSSRIAMPLQNDNLTSMYWLGESKDAATFGAAWDQWRNSQGDSESTESKLSARFEECSTNVGRWGYDIY